MRTNKYFQILDLDHPMYHPETFDTLEEAKEVLDKEYTNRNKQDIHNEYWQNRRTGIQKVIVNTTFVFDNKKKDNLEYYGNYAVSYLEDRDTTYEYFDESEEVLDKVLNLIREGYDDIHVLKFNSDFGYEVINNYLQDESN